MPREIVWTAGTESDLLRLYNRVGDHDLALRDLGTVIGGNHSSTAYTKPETQVKLRPVPHPA